MSPTFTATPPSYPYRIKISAYNEAGELVKELYEGGIAQPLGPLSLSRDIFLAGSEWLEIGMGAPLQGGAVPRWDGTNGGGQAVSAGVYTIKADVSDRFGKVDSFMNRAQVAPAPQGAKLEIFNAAGELVYTKPLAQDYKDMSLEQASFSPSFDPGDGHALSWLKVDFQDASRMPHSLLWDGKNAAGRPVDSGTYTLQLTHHKPELSNPIVESKQVSVLRATEDAPFAWVKFGPNPAKSGGELQILYPSAAQGAKAELFALNGERAAAASDPSASGRIRLSLASLAPGSYLLRLSLPTGSKILKIAILPSKP